MKRILVDRHQSDLFYALQRLFEDRLSTTVYTPIGRDWWDSAVWRFGEVYGDERLVDQYLTADARHREVAPGLFLTFDQCHPERPVWCVTLEWAMRHQWAYILASVPENEPGFARFAAAHGAKYLYHIGNARQSVDWSLSPLVIDSSLVLKGERVVHAAQEFDHLSTFRYRPPIKKPRRVVTSFVNLLPGIEQSWKPWLELKDALPEFGFRAFGHNCPDGFLTPVAAIAEEMALAMWAYHDKPTGDGYGHCIHNWAAVGRPLVGHAGYYQGQRAEVFWRDGETCIDLDKHSIEETARIIREMPTERYEAMCRAIRAGLERSYSPALDAEAVATFLKQERSQVKAAYEQV